MPPKNPVTVSRLALFGAIHVIQLKTDRAWNRYPGNQNQLILRSASVAVL